MEESSKPPVMEEPKTVLTSSIREHRTKDLRKVEQGETNTKYIDKLKRDTASKQMTADQLRELKSYIPKDHKLIAAAPIALYRIADQLNPWRPSEQNGIETKWQFEQVGVAMLSGNEKKNEYLMNVCDIQQGKSLLVYTQAVLVTPNTDYRMSDPTKELGRAFQMLAIPSTHFTRDQGISAFSPSHGQTVVVGCGHMIAAYSQCGYYVKGLYFGHEKDAVEDAYFFHQEVRKVQALQTVKGKVRQVIKTVGKPMKAAGAQIKKTFSKDKIKGAKKGTDKESPLAAGSPTAKSGATASGSAAAGQEDSQTEGAEAEATTGAEAPITVTLGSPALDLLLKHNPKDALANWGNKAGTIVPGTPTKSPDSPQDSRPRDPAKDFDIVTLEI